MTSVLTPTKNTKKFKKLIMVWVSKQGLGLDKIKCTTKDLVLAEGEQPEIVRIFQGRGKCTREYKIVPWHSYVDGYCQQKALVDTSFSLK